MEFILVGVLCYFSGTFIFNEKDRTGVNNVFSNNVSRIFRTTVLRSSDGSSDITSNVVEAKFVGRKLP